MSAALDASAPTGRSAVAARAALASRTSLRTPSGRQAGVRSGAAVLRLVPQRRSKAAKTPFVVVVVALLGGGLLGLLLLNTALAQDAFQLHALKTQGRELAVREQALQRDVESLRTPEALAARAQAMGMVPAGPPAFLRLSDGAVIGAPEAGVAPIEPGGKAAAEAQGEQKGEQKADDETDEQVAEQERRDEAPGRSDDDTTSEDDQ